MKNTFMYYTERNPHKMDWRNKVETVFEADDLDSVAEDCAEDYEYNCDGWESSWPIVFHIWDEKDNYLGCRKVEKEYSPSFSASEVAA